MNLMKKIITIVLLFVAINSFAATFLSNSSYEVFFTPQDNCTQEIINAIATAKKQILIQAFSFTDKAIAKSLVEAKNRGVEVKILLDKSQLEDPYAATNYLVWHNILPKIDYIPEDYACAHNKVIIIDGNIVITGSFNFTKTAQAKNTENLLIIHDANLAQRYQDNWYRREKIARDIPHNKRYLNRSLCFGK
jgi:phosphatidylserine/phosphatidylglycerophosphate/cardiolipin synthase-like enzyme